MGSENTVAVGIVGILGVVVLGHAQHEKATQEQEKAQDIFSKAKIEIIDVQKTETLENSKVEYASKDTLYTVTAADLRAMGVTPPSP